MIIGIDGNEANTGKRVGIGQYAYQVLKHIHITCNKEHITKKTDDLFKIFLKEPPLGDMPQKSEWWRYELVRPKRFWTQVGLPFHLTLLLNRPDVFFSPSHYAPRFTNVTQYISIMDMSFIRFPKLFTPKDRLQLTHWTSYSVKKARKIFTISEFSKKEIVEIYNIPQDNVVVTYPGYDSEKFKVPFDNSQGRQSSKFKVKETDLLKDAYGIKNNYILFVGTLQPRKNIVSLIQAYKLVAQKLRNKQLELVIIGKKGWFYEEIFSSIIDLGLEKMVRILDFVSDNDLPLFYRNARCFVLPSFYEGFGIPVIEAMACGCPTVVSNVSSLPEITGDAAVLVNPNSIESIAEGIEKVIISDKLQKELSQKGLDRVILFSWMRCAQITLRTLLEKD